MILEAIGPQLAALLAGTVVRGCRGATFQGQAAPVDNCTYLVTRVDTVAFEAATLVPVDAPPRKIGIDYQKKRIPKILYVIVCTFKTWFNQ
eukprot:1807271-Amphidinium_carterae.1